MTSSTFPRLQEFNLFADLIDKIPETLEDFSIGLANNELTMEFIDSLCDSLNDRELRKLGLGFSGCGILKAPFVKLFSFIKEKIFIEDELCIDISV